MERVVLNALTNEMRLSRLVSNLRLRRQTSSQEQADPTISAALLESEHDQGCRKTTAQAAPAQPQELRLQEWSRDRLNLIRSKSARPSLPLQSMLRVLRSRY